MVGSAAWASTAAWSNTGWAYSMRRISLSRAGSVKGLSDTTTGVSKGSGCRRLMR